MYMKFPVKELGIGIYSYIGSYLFFSRFEEGTMDIFPFGLFLFFNVFCFGDIFRVAIMLHSRIISDG